MHNAHSPAYICRHCMDEGRPILLVVRDRDGDWQFLCGGGDHESAEQCALICRSCLFERDSSLEGIEMLPIGHEAERASGTDRKWEVAKLPNEKDET